MVMLDPITKADFILCLPLEAELVVDPHDIAVVAEVLFQDGVVAIYAASTFAPSAVFELYIRPALAELFSDRLQESENS
jgi:hypothetical protein